MLDQTEIYHRIGVNQYQVIMKHMKIMLQNVQQNAKHVLQEQIIV